MSGRIASSSKPQRFQARWKPARVKKTRQTKESGPGALFPELRLIGVDRALLLHRQPDVVEAVQQAVLSERIDLELHLAAVGTADLLVRQVDGQRGVGAALGVVEELVEVFLRHADRQN